jgi:SAM-dependent methyltransferase
MFSQRSGAAEAYDHLAPVYDEFNAQNDYEIWLGAVLLPELAAHGLKDRPASDDSRSRVLDIGCGTGRAFDPLLARGWQVFGIDLSTRMLEKAAKHPAASGDRRLIHLTQADARALPGYDHPFDLILALNDVINYATEDGDLELVFGGIARSLSENGLVCFDVNTLGLMRTNFAGEGMVRGEWRWGGRAREVVPGGTYEAELEGPGIATHVHRQRHWTDDEIRGALGAAGLTCRARLGQREESGRIIFSPSVEEERDAKAIYIGARNV